MRAEVGWAVRAALLSVSACCAPGATDGGPGDGGGSSAVGSCAADGGCPLDAYCQPFLTQCSGQIGLSVQIGSGTCYLSNPCGGGSCSGSPCTSDADCGQSLVCDANGLCCDSVLSICAGSGTGDGVTPQCPSPVPDPCPPGCILSTPPHGCRSCLCATCPPPPGGGGRDGGLGPDGGADGGV